MLQSVRSLLNGCAIANRRDATGSFSSVNHLMDFKPKAVSGDFLKAQGVDISKSSFVISFGKFNLIYRAFDQTMLLGGTTNSKEWSLPNEILLKRWHSVARHELGEDFPLPAFSKFEIITGIRHKGIQRKPFWGRLKAPNDFPLYGLFSLYKNGFTLPFLGGEVLADLVLEELGIAQHCFTPANLLFTKPMDFIRF